MPAGTRSTSSVSATSTPAAGVSKKTTEQLDMDSIKRLISESIQEMLPKLIESTFSKLAIKYESLRTENENLRSRIEQLEDEKYASEVEVCGIPEQDGDNLNEIAKSILSKLKVDDHNLKDGIVKAYRLPRPKDSTSKSRQPPKVVIKLSTPYLKSVAYNNRIKNQIKAKDLGFTNSSNKIYINERLRPELRPVLHQLLGLKRNKKIHSVWTQRQRIMVRVTASDTPEPVTNYELFISNLG